MGEMILLPVLKWKQETGRALKNLLLKYQAESTGRKNGGQGGKVQIMAETVNIY